MRNQSDPSPGAAHNYVLLVSTVFYFLLSRVEQQLMSRMVSEMYRPPPSDPAYSISTDQSDSQERSVTSDIGEWTD